MQAVGRDANTPVFAGTVLAALVKSTTATPPVAVSCPPARLLLPVHEFVPANSGNNVVSGTGFFQVLVAGQNHNN
jgi:hypothetical protein